ncbi:hypothetical protein Sde_3685 [Saccharophagus degradans 2-40]|uniref:Uncharacterized protein n=2 Tax=Saccharophagus degradans TaxID=86304 RepID=Q21ED9_SACD2|nr:hypothetical protein Sde_3685 [Saccharophagus degradans 2-40]
MMVSHPLPIPLPFTSELYGVRLFNGCWLFAKQTFQPSYWMMLKREGFSGDLVGSSSELSLVLGMLGAEHLRAIYTLYHGTPPTHYFDFSLRGDIEHLILSGRIKAFYLSEDKTERLGNPQDVLYATPETIDLNCESPVIVQRYRLAEELAKDIMARWTQKDAEDLAHWDRFFLWRKGYEVYDITAEAFDTVYDFIVGLKDIAVFVVELSYESAKTHLKVNRALLEMTYKGATGDIDGLNADLAKIGVMVDEKIDSAQKLIAQAEQGKKIFDALVNDPLTRNLIFDFLDSLYQSISYRESRTLKARIVFEIGIEVLLVLATAGIGNVARRTAQTARATTNAIKATKTAQRIGPFTKHALDLMADLGKVLHKPINVEEIKPIKQLEIPDFGKLSKSELDGVGGSKATVKAPESWPSTATVRERERAPNKINARVAGQLDPETAKVYTEINASRSNLVKPRKPTVDNPNISQTIPNADGSSTYVLKSSSPNVNNLKVTYDAEGFPDFSPYLYDKGVNTVNIKLTGNRNQDFALANQLAGFGNSAKSTPKHFTWHHHQDLGVMQLVRTDVHKLSPHTGGVSIWEKAFGFDYVGKNKVNPYLE